MKYKISSGPKFITLIWKYKNQQKMKTFQIYVLRTIDGKTWPKFRWGSAPGL